MNSASGSSGPQFPHLHNRNRLSSKAFCEAVSLPFSPSRQGGCPAPRARPWRAGGCRREGASLSPALTANAPSPHRGGTGASHQHTHRKGQLKDCSVLRCVASQSWPAGMPPLGSKHAEPTCPGGASVPRILAGQPTSGGLAGHLGHRPRWPLNTRPWNQEDSSLRGPKADGFPLALQSPLGPAGP